MPPNDSVRSTESQMPTELESSPLLPVARLAELWDVTPQAVYQWHQKGHITCLQEHDGHRVASERAARAEKVLRRNEVRRRLIKSGVADSAIGLAVQLEAVRPICWAGTTEPRFSLDDVDAISNCYREQTRPSTRAALAPGGPRSVNESVAPEPIEDAGDDRHDRRRAVFEYLCRGQSPCDLPLWFWDNIELPEFVPPLGVFRCEFADRAVDPVAKRVFTEVTRTAGYQMVDGELTFVPADPCWTTVDGVHPIGGTPPWLQSENRTYDLARDEWINQYRHHGPYRNENPASIPGIRRDREAAIRRYLALRQRPCDLPRWFWDTPEMPPFVAPLDVALFVCGEQTTEMETGRVVTYVRRSAGWGETFEPGDRGPAIHFIAADDHWFPVNGAYPPGAVPPEFVEANWRYELARQEWELEWQRHRQAQTGEAEPDRVDEGEASGE